MRALPHVKSKIASAIFASLIVSNQSLAAITSSGIVTPSPPGTPDWTETGRVIQVGDPLNLSATGALFIDGGSIVSSNGGRISSGEVTVDGTGSIWSSTDLIYLGDKPGGKGALFVKNGGFVNLTTNTLHIGFIANGTGQVEVSGSGSLIQTTGSTNVGLNGTGMLLITDGAKVVTQGAGGIASNLRSAGQVLVSGEQSRWDVSQRLYIGWQGDGILTITDGGVVTAESSRIAAGTSSTGSLTVNGLGSSLNITNLLDIGTNGPASMLISDGGHVTSKQGYINDSTATVSVTGSGSRWDTQDLRVGLYPSSNSRMYITDGGSVSSLTTYIGSNRSNSSVTIDGPGSSLTSTNSLTMSSNGTLLLSNSGKLKVGGPLSLLEYSAIIIGSASGMAPVAAGLLGATTVILNGSYTSLIFNHSEDDYVFNPVITGTGNVQVEAGTSVFTASNTYSGTTNVDGGTLQAGAGNTFSANSDHMVGLNGVIDLAGYNQTVNNLTNSGTVSLKGSRAGTLLTVNGNYTGDGGLLAFGTELGDDTSLTDRMIVKGDTSGTSRVSVDNLGGRGSDTINGIELITVEGNSSGTFTQNGRIVAGAYDYSLVRKGNNWNLTSEPTAIIEPPPVTPPPVTPPPVVPPAHVQEAVLRPEAGAYTANLAAAASMFEPRLRYRNGNTYIDNETGELKYTSLWMHNRAAHSRSTDSSGQLSTQGNTYSTLLGVDLTDVSGTAGRLRAGVFAGAGRNTSNTDSDVTGYDARGRVTGYTTGAYATWYQSGSDRQGLWLDSVLQYGWFDNTVSGEGLASEDYMSRGMTASLEAGYVMSVWQNALTSVYVQPQGQVQWSGISADRHTEKNGTVLSGTGEDNVRTRLGMKVFADTSSTGDKGTRNFRPYAEVNWVHNSSEYGVKMDDVKVDGRGSRNLAEVGAGMEGQLSRNLNVTGSVSHLQGTDSWSETAATIGIRYSF